VLWECYRCVLDLTQLRGIVVMYLGAHELYHKCAGNVVGVHCYVNERNLKQMFISSKLKALKLQLNHH